MRDAILEIPTAEMIRSRMETIKDISGQFVEDVNVILEKFPNDAYVIMVLHELVRKFLNRIVVFSSFSNKT